MSSALAPTEMQQRAAVVDAARGWLRTPWVHRQHLRGVGVDCGWLLIECYAEAGVIDWFDPGEYVAQWHLHRNRELYLEILSRFAVEITPDAANLGDVIMLRYGRTFSHGGVLIGGTRMIHALYRVGVTEGDWASEVGLSTTPRRFFRPRSWVH